MFDSKVQMRRSTDRQTDSGRFEKDRESGEVKSHLGLLSCAAAVMPWAGLVGGWAGLGWAGLGWAGLGWE